MRARRPLPVLHLISDINVTNLVDVTMVLLVVFIMVAPMIETKVDVSLPEVEYDDQEEPDKPSEIIVLSVTKDQAIMWEDESIPLERLIFRLREEQAKDPKLGVLLRADEGLDYGFVMKVLDRIKGAGVTTIDLATTPKTQ